MVQRPETDSTTYDVAILGGGLAGLTLARQIALEEPGLSVVLVDRLSRPLPDAAFKVGESTVEIGAQYLAGVLQLREYMTERQLPKYGLRYFMGGGTGPVHRRPEFGLSHFAPVRSYQIDRGVLENDLREMADAAGIELLEGWSVADVELGAGESPHTVLCQKVGNGSNRTLRCRWVVDAMGRRRLLQKKLGFARKAGHGCSSVWFRYEGRVDITDLVPASEQSWHARLAEGTRYLSTNHLMGDGYWVWLIPLCTGNTSVGIVAREDVHAFDSYRTYERAMEWLERYEPVLAAHLAGREPMDFLCMRNYSYSSRRVFSEQRWTCVGESGVFVDPLYSPGTDFIGYGNSMTIELIRADREGRLDRTLADEYNNFYLSLTHWLTNNIQRGYPYMGRATAMTSKILWDTCSAWGFLAPQMFAGIYRDPARRERYRQASSHTFELGFTMQQLLSDWGERAPGGLALEFIDYLSVPLLRDLHIRNLQTGKEEDELLADQAQNVQRFEELAQVLFLLAVEDVLPEQFHRLSPDGWYNAWALSLDPSRWDEDGVFAPSTAPRALRPVWESFRKWFLPALGTKEEAMRAGSKPAPARAAK
jgi:flavin-dependent dehydrogenase